MKNIELLFSENGTKKDKGIILQGNTIYIELVAKGGIFTGEEIKKIVGIVNFIHHKYGKLKYSIEFYFGEIIFIDKLVYVFLECICYYLIKVWSHPVQVIMKVQNDIRTKGIVSSPLLLLNNTKMSSIEKYPEHFEFEIYGYHFRKVIKCRSENTNYLGNLYEEIDRFLKPFSIESKYRDEVALVITELVGNACEHALTDCLIDIDVASDYKKESMNIIDTTNYYYGINIAVINFSEKLLGDDIKNNIVNIINEKELPDRYMEVMKAYKNHQKKFDEQYGEEDFCNITAFQSRISGRKDKFMTGGTGLPVLVRSLEEKSDVYRCYVISGNRSINFFDDSLEYDENGWIGFNTQKDYFSNIPKESVVNDCLIYMPGTAYNFNFVMKGEKIVMNKKEIVLKFDKAATRLAGYPYGKNVFAEQVAVNIDYDCLNVIVFPDSIEKVASSFVQGFFAEIIEKVGYANFDKVICIKARDSELINNIKADLFA